MPHGLITDGSGPFAEHADFQAWFSNHMEKAIENGEPVSEELWAELDLARQSAVLDSSGQRPGRMSGDTGPSTYARCFHNVARAAELLQWWSGSTPEYVEIAYTARHIAKEAELWPTMAT